MARTILGSNTDTIIYKKNGNEIHHSFEVGQKSVNTGTQQDPVYEDQDTEIKLGTPVAILANGKVVSLADVPAGAAGAISPLYIGVALMDRKTGEQITICLRGRIVVKGLASGVVPAGPVNYSTTDESTVQVNLDVPVFTAVAAPDNETELIGWALNSAEDDVIYVLYKH